MGANPDFSDLLSEFNAARVRYLVVGAHAVMHHTEPRYTKALDIWVEPTAVNAARTWAALARFGAPLHSILKDDFTDPSLIYQIGVEPNRIDILTHIDGVTFGTAWRNRVKTAYGGVSISVLSLNDIVRAKLAAGRSRDLLDVEALREAKSLRAKKTRRKLRRPK